METSTLLENATYVGYSIIPIIFFFPVAGAKNTATARRCACRKRRLKSSPILGNLLKTTRLFEVLLAALPLRQDTLTKR